MTKKKVIKSKKKVVAKKPKYKGTKKKVISKLRPPVISSPDTLPLLDPNGPYRRDTLHFIPETSFTLFGTQKDRPLVQL